MDKKEQNGTTLTKQEMAEVISAEIGFSLRTSKKLVTGLFDIIREELQEEIPVKIVRFGVFKPVCKNARKGINPHTGEEIIIEARKTVTFKPSTLLKKRVNAEKGQKILQDRGDKPDHRG